MQSHLLPLKDTHNVFWRVTHNVSKNLGCLQENSTGKYYIFLFPKHPNYHKSVHIFFWKMFPPE